MAHPLTQQPASALGFGFAPRTSPLTFGFGFSSPNAGPSTLASSSFGVHRSTSPAKQTPVISPGFGSARLFRRETQPPNALPKASLKRSRRRSSSSSLSLSSPTSPSAPSSSLPKDVKTGRDELGVGGLALNEGPRKMVKRTRIMSDLAKESTTDKEDNLDVGILLASLPASSHLPILLQLLQSHPSLSSTILPLLPAPDLNECEIQISRLYGKLRRGLGTTSFGSIGPENRSTSVQTWQRQRPHVDELCRMCSTYLDFFTKHASSDAQQTCDILLLLSTYLVQLLALSPLEQTGAAEVGATPIAHLGNAILQAWEQWVAKLSDEVNRQGGMYAAFQVKRWVNSLDQISGRQDLWGPNGEAAANGNHPLVAAFRRAVEPIREKFMTELGWLVGR